ncbi:MAG: NTP transferase domain-containing protein [Elusimicrobiaceae bacterium]|nr:NTP transferase domain-containing protein [Elusimicrobiaceae bacterium]
MNHYTAIIPAAGKGVRLLPYTEHCPKTMLSVAGKPIIAHILAQLEECGIKRVVFIVGYQKESLIEFVHSHYPHLDVVFIEQQEQKGLGHAVYLAKQAVQGPCLIVLGDTIIDGDLAPLVQGNINGVGVKMVEDPHRFGVVELDDHKIVGFEEKPEHPKSNLALIGAYSFLDSAVLFESLEEVIASGKTVKNEIQLTDALENLLEKGLSIQPIVMNDWFDCGTLDSMLYANHALLDRMHSEKVQISSSTRIIEPCWIDPSAVVEDCVLGPYVSVGEKAVVRRCQLQDTIISPNTKLQDKHGTHFIFDPYNN